MRTTSAASSGSTDGTDGGRCVIPRGPVRRRQIAEVAERVFLAHGYGSTTMLMVAEAAGASKITLYRHFGTKEDLFAEVVQNRAARLNGNLRAIFEDSGGLGVVLRRVGVTLLTELTSPAVIALLRMVAAETPRDLNVGRVLHAHGPSTGEAALAEYLKRERTRGGIQGIDPGLAADIFLSALTGHVLLGHLFLIEAPVLSPDEIAYRVESVVSMFLAAYDTKSMES